MNLLGNPLRNFFTHLRNGLLKNYGRGFFN